MMLFSRCLLRSVASRTLLAPSARIIVASSSRSLIAPTSFSRSYALTEAQRIKALEEEIKEIDAMKEAFEKSIAAKADKSDIIELSEELQPNKIPVPNFFQIQVYVLPEDITASTIKKTFSEFGNVTDVKLIWSNALTHRHQRAFVTYESTKGSFSAFLAQEKIRIGGVRPTIEFTNDGDKVDTVDNIVVKWTKAKKSALESQN